ncbi:MAG: glucosaminidase domain-containing protein [Helicobacteraceae bacterium]|jgi:Bax protein|nr:glucosaminidase domain-containing protein [Helicobacteraceae bacterium]
MGRNNISAPKTATKNVVRFSKLSKAILALVAIAVFLLIAPAYLYWFGDIASLKTYEVAIEERYFAAGGAPEPIESKSVKPIIYMNAPSLKDLNSSERKKRFIETILPSILIVKHRREQERELAIAIMNKSYPTRSERLFMRNLYETYRAKTAEELLLKLQTHPNSVAIAQAALESAWGTSNVFLETNNLFGVWSFSENEPRYLAVVRKKGVKVYVRRYQSMYESIEDYFRVVAIGRAFEEFRARRAEGMEPLELAALLEMYSEQRKEYVQKLRYVIKSNDLTRFDDYSLEKAYLFLKAAL